MEQPDVNIFELQLDQPALGYLNESARWAKFLSIVGFVSCGLMVIVGVFFGSIMANLMSGMGNASSASMIGMMGGGFFGFFYILVSLVIFFPSLYLYKFSVKVKRAHQNNDQSVLTDSLKNLKSFFKFYGIFTLIFLSLYALILIAAIFGAIVGSRH